MSTRHAFSRLLLRLWRRVSLIGVLGLVFWTGAASAFEPQIPQYVHDLWTTEQGLRQNIVSHLLASRDGYLWIGANNGITRFDGLTFTTFDLTNTPALRANRVTAFHQSADGAIWIGTGKGMVRYQAGAFTREEGDAGFAEEQIKAICDGPEKGLFSASPAHVYRRDRSGRWVRLPIQAADEGITSLVTDARGSLWIASGRELVEWRGRVVRTMTVSDRRGVWISALSPATDGRIWIGMSRGLARLDPATGAIVHETGALASMDVRRLLMDRDAVLWIGAVNTLATRTPDGRVDLYPIANPTDEATVAALAQDVAGQIWYGIGGGPGGLHRLTPRRVTVYTRAQGLPCDNIAAVAASPDGTIWLSALCASGGGLVALKDGRIRTYLDPTGATSLISALLPLSDGEILIGTFRNGLFRFANGPFSAVPGPFRPLLADVNALYRDEAGALWAGTTEGLARYQDGQWRVWRAADGLPSNDVHTIAPGRDGALWIGTGLGVARFQDDRLVAYAQAEGIPPSEVRALHVDEEGAVWIGTYGRGLARLHDGHVVQYGSAGGLLDPSVHRIIDDGRGNFWLSGDRGIRRVSRRELAAARGPGSSPRVAIFDTRDGMTSAECNGMGQPAGVRGRDGVLWFPTQGGLVRLDPAAADLNMLPAPPVSIAAVRVAGVPQPDDARAEPEPARLLVPPGARDFEIRYAAPALTRPEQLYFKYRLLGYSDEWIDAGTWRVVHFAGLGPGEYQFQVTARDGAGDWSATSATLRVVLQPRLYQRFSFKVTSAVVVLVGLVFGVKWRLRQLDRRAQALEGIVAARTSELQTQTRVLEAQTRELEVERAALQAANAKIEETHVRLLATFNQLRVGVTLVDAEARVRFLSEATRPLVGGRPFDELIGQPLERALPISPESLAAIRSQLRAAQPGGRIAVELTPESGQRYWAEIEVHPDLRDPEQRVLHLYDVTETFELKRALQTGPHAVGSALLGESVAICNLRHEIATVAGLDATVLLEGETGTGKELVARAIHDASRRKARPFVAINCGGLTESLLASQLFGHRRGAFTGAVTDQRGLFEAAHGGTLLLDEIGDMPLGMQTYLLRVLEERKFLRLGDSTPQAIDVRLLAATHRDLETDVKEGRFREDLLYRIRVVRLRLPPLRLRGDDIPMLAMAFLQRLRTAHSLKVESISREAMTHLQAHRWPGNVRELKATIEGAAIRAAGPVMKLSDVLHELPSEQIPETRGPRPDRERHQLLDALRQTGGNRSAAARMLGWPRSTFYKRLAKLEVHGVETPEEPPD